MFPSTTRHLNLHPHCYSAEGIWVAASLKKDNTYYKSVELAVDWIKKNSKKNMPPRIFFNKKKIIYNSRIDAISQFLRLMILLNIDQNIKIDKNLIVNLLNKILQNFYKSKNEILNGGFYWGLSSNGKNMHSINTWTSAFILQTLIYIQIMLHNKKIKLNPFYII
jgi:hypothetical protein